MCLHSACESTVAWRVLSGSIQQLQKFWKNCRNDRCQWPKCFTLNAHEKYFLWLLRLDCFLKNTTWQRSITPKIYFVRRHWQNRIVLPNQYFWLGPWRFNFMISLFLSFRIASEYACVLDQPGRLSRFKRLFGVQVSWFNGICWNVKSLWVFAMVQVSGMAADLTYYLWQFRRLEDKLEVEAFCWRRGS